MDWRNTLSQETGIKNLQPTREISQEQLEGDIQKLGIKNGDHVALGVSFKSIGKVSGGPGGLIEALLKVVGPGGTIMIPAFTPNYPLYLVRKHKAPVYNKKATPSTDGLISETIRTDPRAIRSEHPTNSFAAIGAKAGYLLKEHNQEKPSYWPYSKLAEIQGKVLIIGINYRFVGIRHQAQYLAGLLTRIPPLAGALYTDDHNAVKIFVRPDLQGCVERLPDMIEDLRKAGIVTESNIGQARAVAVPAKESLEIMTDLLVRSPENYLCDSAMCLWCREIERRLKLTPKVPRQKWFQKYAPLRFLLNLVNYFRLKDPGVFTPVKIFLARVLAKVLRSLKILK